MIKAIKWFFGFYRNRRKNTRPQIKGLPEYISYFTNTPQSVIKQHRK